MPDVRFGSKADVALGPPHVRSTCQDVRFGPIADTVPSKPCLKSEGSHYYAVR
jgi:hypothetical protein